MAFDSKEFGWPDIAIVFAGRPIVGCTAINYKLKSEREFVYGLGKKPVAYADGQEMVDGSITLLQSEFESLVRSLPSTTLLLLRLAKSHVSELPPHLVQVVIW